MRNGCPAPFSRKLATLVACAWMALPGAIHFSNIAFAASDADDIRSLIGSTWDRPDSKVETDPILISGSYAVASWTQADRGGRALLRRNGNKWAVVLCSGDPLTQVQWLVEAGVAEPDAQVIAAELAVAEAQIPADRRAKFSLFEGVVRADDDHTHHRK